MLSNNVVSLLGKVTKDPTIEYQNNGQLPIMKFGLLVKNQNEMVENSFYFVQRKGSNAESTAKMLKKGDEVLVVGKMYSYQKKVNDALQYNVVVNADFIGLDTDLSFAKKFKREENSISSNTISMSQNTNTMPVNVVQMPNQKQETVVNLVAESRVKYGRMNIPDNIDSLLDDVFKNN